MLDHMKKIIIHVKSGCLDDLLFDFLKSAKCLDFPSQFVVAYHLIPSTPRQKSVLQKCIICS